MNQTNIYVRITAVVELKDKDKAAGLEIAKSVIPCGHQSYKIHIKSIAIFIHNHGRMKVAKG
jgi:hypothetical protein